jgi:hypothetical protein
LKPEDLRQAAVVLDSANSEAPLPRNVLSTPPKLMDPFHYPDSAEK